jgi:cytochrome c oxidase subunit 2
VEEWRTPAPTANAPEAVVAEADEAVEGAAEAPNGGEAEAEQVAAAEANPTQTGAAQAGAVEAGAEDPLVARGRQVFFRETTCVLCHAIQGTPAPGVIGPNLTRLGSRTTIAAGMLENTPENLELWIRDPLSVKPGAQMPGADYGATIAGIPYPATNLNDEQIQALAAYLSSMR